MRTDLYLGGAWGDGKVAKAHIGKEPQETVRRLTTLRQEDIFSDGVMLDLSANATAIGMYLIPTALERIRPMLETCLEPGTRVLTVGYPLVPKAPTGEQAVPEWESLGESQVMDLELFAYRKR
jgi:hypothetical protein